MAVLSVSVCYKVCDVLRKTFAVSSPIVHEKLKMVREREKASLHKERDRM